MTPAHCELESDGSVILPLNAWFASSRYAHARTARDKMFTGLYSLSLPVALLFPHQLSRLTRIACVWMESGETNAPLDQGHAGAAHIATRERIDAVETLGKVSVTSSTAPQGLGTSAAADSLPQSTKYSLVVHRPAR